MKELRWNGMKQKPEFPEAANNNSWSRITPQHGLLFAINAVLHTQYHEDLTIFNPFNTTQHTSFFFSLFFFLFLEKIHVISITFFIDGKDF